MNENKLKNIKRTLKDPTAPNKDFPPHYERHRPYHPGVKRILKEGWDKEKFSNFS